MGKKAVKYLENNIEKGILYDWDAVYNHLNKIIVDTVGENAGGIYIPTNTNTIWNVYLSERDCGKSTQMFLIGLILYEWYGTRTELIRNFKDDIKPQNARELFDTILEFGYIEKITNGRWNNLFYDIKRKGWVLINIDNDGNVLDMDKNLFMRLHSLNADYVDGVKSNYNSPRGDWLILDEFIPMHGKKLDDYIFSRLCHLISTIVRRRETFKINMLANVIDTYNIYFHEMNIFDTVYNMKVGEVKTATASEGTKVTITKIKFNELTTKKRREHILKIFGFGNKKLLSITGGGEWEIKQYPRLPRQEHNEIVEKYQNDRCYFYIYGRTLCGEFRQSSVHGCHFFIWFPNKEPDKNTGWHFTLDNPKLANEFYKLGLGSDVIGAMIWDLYKQNRIYYSYNDAGDVFEQFINECLKK